MSSVTGSLISAIIVPGTGIFSVSTGVSLEHPIVSSVKTVMLNVVLIFIIAHKCNGMTWIFLTVIPIEWA